MSRATVDLQSVRFFLGYGLVFIAPERADDPARARSRCSLLQPGAGARSRSIPVPFVVVVAARYGRRSRPALQEVQQRIAELTADVEENISGVRVVKAFAAEPRQLERFRAQRRARVRPVDVRDAAARLLQPVHRLPAEPRPRGDPARRRPPGDQRHADARRLHRLLHVPADADRRRCGMLGIALGMAQRATASGARLFEILDREPRLVAPAGRAAAAGRARARRAARRHVRLRRTGRRRCATSTSTSTAGTTVALVGATGSGKTTLVAAARRGSTTSTAGAVLIDGADVRDGRPRARCARAIARRRPTTRSCSRATVARQHRLRAAGRDAARRSSGPPSARRPPASSPSCPTATTRSSASAG